MGPSKRRFEEIFAEGKRLRGKFLTIVGLPGTGLVGFATSRKIGSHVQRNRQRRRVQAAYRQTPFRLERALDLVVIVAPATEHIGTDEIGSELNDLLRKMEARWAGESESS